MAKVKIQGHASGTGVLTVTAPNTDTDRTITLPDSTGTLATTADNGSQLDHSGSKKIEAVSTGAAVTGNLTTTGNISTGNNGMVFILDSAGQTSGRIVTDSSAANALEIGADPNNQAAGSYTAFRVDNTERMRITPDGLTFNGDTASANALDDYEEGTWTPTSSSDFGTFSNIVGKYTKIGNLVYVKCYFEYTGASTTASKVMGGLPYAPRDDFSASSVEGQIQYWAADFGRGYISQNSTIVLVTESSLSGTFSAQTSIRMHGWYIT